MQDSKFSRRAQLAALCAAGKSNVEAAAALGLKIATVRFYAWKWGIRFPSRSAPPPPAPRSTCYNVVPMVREWLREEPAIMATRPRAATTESWTLHVAAYVANVELGATAAAAGRMIERHEGLVRYAVRRIEELRETPAVDDFLDRIGEHARKMAA